MLMVVCLAPSFMTGAQTPDPGQQIFGSTCAACHGLDGQGGEHAPNIATDPDVQHMTDREITGIVRYGIQGKGMPGFQSSLQHDQITAVIKYLRTMGTKAAAGSLPGDASRGKQLFFGAARCGECHSIQGSGGGFLGMDLSGYGKSRSAAAIREAIIDPNKNGNQKRGTVTVVTRSGKTYTGIARNEDNFTLQMQSPDGAFHLFEKRDIARLDHGSKSLMPSDYAQKLSASQLDDLLKFLTASTSSESKDPDSDE